MITVLKQGTTVEQRDQLIKWFEDQGLRVHVSVGEYQTVLGLIGDTTKVDTDMLELLDIVDFVKRITEPFKNANRKFHPEDTVIDVGGAKIGGGNFAVIAGPCSVETEEQITEVARRVKAAGATMLRGGAFKPRTSPYDFQGYGEKALKFLRNAADETGLLTVSEIMDASDLEMMCKYVDVLQIGARNVQNFKLLHAVGKCNKPVILKRGLASTIREFLLAAEHILYYGNPNVILCERGIRSFDSAFTRNVMDIASIPVIKKYSHLPIIVDPSHGTGQRYLIEPLAKAGLVVGADGVMIEVHNNPEYALSDGKQSLSIPMFKDIMKRLNSFNNRLHYEKTCLSANVK